MKRRLLSLSAVVAGLVLGMGALTTGGNAQAQESPQATLDAVVTAWNAGDAEAFLSYLTPDALMDIVGIEYTVEAVEANMEETGPIADYSLSNLRIEGGAFTGLVELQFEGGFGLFELWTFQDTDDGWVIAGSEPASRPIPPGVPTVDMTLQEYAFVYNEAAIQAADGNFAFEVTNAGEEEHEIVVLGIDSDQSLQELLEAGDPESEDLPEGLEFITFGGIFEPGETGTTVFDQPLGPGRYGLVCFIPSPEGVPHAFLGMISEFEIGGGPVDDGDDDNGGSSPITPPSTGNGGLLDASTDSSVLVVVAAMLVFGGLGGLFAFRRA